MGGELFSLGDLFPSRDCAENFLGSFEVDDKDVVDDSSGNVQSKIGELLNVSTEKFWVDAQYAESTVEGLLYSYEGEPPVTYHFLPTGNRQGDCLTYRRKDGKGGLITMVRQTSRNELLSLKPSLTYLEAISTDILVKSFITNLTS